MSMPSGEDAPVLMDSPEGYYHTGCNPHPYDEVCDFPPKCVPHQAGQGSAAEQEEDR